MNRFNRSHLRDGAVLVLYLLSLLIVGHLLRYQTNETIGLATIVVSAVAGAAVGRQSPLFLALFIEWAVAVYIFSGWQVLEPDQNESVGVLLIVPVVWLFVLGAFALGTLARSRLASLQSN